jgi:hypothetical protein
MRTQGLISADVGQKDGHIFVGPGDFEVTSGTATATRNASGDVSLNIGASQTCVLVASLSKLLFRYGMQDYVFAEFGSAQAGGAQGLPVGGTTTLTTASAGAGSFVNVVVLSSTNFTVGNFVSAGTQKAQITAIPDGTHITLNSLSATLASGSVITQNLFTTPAGVTGPPPYTGLSQLTPVTAPRPKGIEFKALYPWYLVSSVALTTNTIGLTKTVAANNTANAVTNILANAANNMQTAIQTNPYLTPIQIASPAFQVTKYTDYIIEWDVTTAAGGAARVYGVYLDVDFNFT